MKRIKSVNMLSGGEILAEPVLTEENAVLIPKGAVLREDYVPLISSLGIESLMVEDPYEDFEAPNAIISEARIGDFVERVRRLMEGHIYHGNKSLKEFEIIAIDLLKEMEDVQDDMILDMNERHANLYEHTVMVTLLSVLIAKKLQLDMKKQKEIAVGCLLHDIGIRYITCPYENCDWEQASAPANFEFKKHTILGYSALEEENWISDISKKMVLSHHENLEGSGFPLRQKNKEIECKIIQVCDAFDGYISGMECKRISVQEALKRLEEAAGTKYDKKIVKNLVAMVAKYPVGTTVTTSTSEPGVVISQTKDPSSPIIMLWDVETDSSKGECNLMLEKNISILGVI